MRPTFAMLVASGTLAAACRFGGPSAADAGDDAATSASASPVEARVPIHGDAFPDGVVALTWDDGPDVHSIELARYLHEQHVAATFFVVGSWVEGLSEEPGVGDKKLATGYEHIPIDELAALGHRVGAHARHHRLLGRATAEIAREELGTVPFIPDRVRFFRPPAGFWTDESKAALAQTAFADFVGPILWDLDAKDWESSLYCRSEAPKTECEPGPIPNETRVRPDVIAARYLARIESAKHGIVLLHDRVGDVGSTYALDVAKHLVPELVKRRYVFAPPVLRFGPLRERTNAPADGKHRGDLNGDGLVDECVATPRGVECALADGDAFKSATVWSSERSDFTLADVNGDGRADLCTRGRCGLAP